MNRFKKTGFGILSILFFIGLSACGSDPLQAKIQQSTTSNSEYQLKQIVNLQTTKLNNSNRNKNSFSKSSANTNVNGNLRMEKDAKVKLQKKVDLFGNGQKETIAVVNLPIVKGQEYSGYLGIWDANGKLLQRFSINGYHIMFPINIYTTDLTGNGKPDIVLETDERANGGNGVHNINVFIQEDNYFSKKPLPKSPASTFIVTYQDKNKDFLIQSLKDKSRTWFSKLTSDTMSYLNKDLLKGQMDVHIDPVSAINVTNGSITTKRLLWFGNLQLNGLGILVTQYQYINGKWEVAQYNIQSGGNAIVSQD